MKLQLSSVPEVNTMRSRADTTSSTAVTGALLAVATCLGFIEATLLPPAVLPGIKIGLANIAVVLALATAGPYSATIVSLGRILLVAIATGSLGGATFAISMTAGIASLAVMYGMSLFRNSFSVVGWSIGGSATHILAQLLTIGYLIGTREAFALSPMLLFVSLGSGLITGFAAKIVLINLPSSSLSIAK